MAGSRVKCSPQNDQDTTLQRADSDRGVTHDTLCFGQQTLQRGEKKLWKSRGICILSGTEKTENSMTEFTKGTSTCLVYLS